MLLSQLSQGRENLFTCVLKNAKILLCLLQTINLNENIIMIFSEKGLQFSCEKNKSFQITGYLQRELFSSFTIPKDTISFKLSIKNLIDCLTSMLILTGNSDDDKDNQNDTNLNTSLDIIYNGTGEPLLLVLKDDISITECSLSPQEPDTMISFELHEQNLISRMIIQSEYFKSILNELNLNSENIQISIDPDYGLVIVTCAQNVTSIKKIPKESRKLINYDFKDLQINSYSTKYLKYSMKALSQSEKTCIKIDENGLLNFEYMVNIFNERCFVQSFILPNIDSSI